MLKIPPTLTTLNNTHSFLISCIADSDRTARG